MTSTAKIVAFWTTVICVAGALWMVASGRHSQTKVTYSQFLALVESGRISSVTVLGSESGVVPAVCRLTDGSSVRTVLPADYRDALRAMQDNHVNIEIQGFPQTLRFLINASPFIALMGFCIFMMRKLRNGPRQGLWS